MTYLKYILYGLIQGFTEFLPISSTAHLKIFSELFGIDDPGSSISAILQLGSVIAILFYFRRDILFRKKSLINFFNRNIFNNRLVKSIFIGTTLISIFGGMVKIFLPNFSNSFLRSNFSIAIISTLMALVMLLSDKCKGKKITLKNHNFSDSLKIGLGQALAIIPGVSRSGITISIALILGWERKDAAKYSFLLGIPAIGLAAIVELLDSIRNGIYIYFGPLLIGLITTFIVSIFTIDFLIKYIPLKGLKIFAYYRILFAIIIFGSYF